MSQSPLVREVTERWEKCSNELVEPRRNYWMNLAFFLDRQWLYWDRQKRAALEINTADEERTYLTINKIKPRVNGLLGRLTGQEFGYEVPPSDTDDHTMLGAKKSEKVVQHLHIEQQWHQTRLENLFNTLLGGTAAIVLDWDPHAGDQLWTDAATDQIVGQGDVSLVALSIAEFGLTPGVRRPADAPWVVCCTALPPEVAAERYDLAEVPAADASSVANPRTRRLFRPDGTPPNDLTLVYSMYERPSRRNRKGKAVVVIGSKDVKAEDWPFPFDESNVRVFHQTRIPGQWTGDTMLNAARPVQVAYNHAMSVIAEHAKLAGNARLMVPVGSLLDELTDEAGEIINYSPDGTGAKPEWLTPAPMGRQIPQWAESLERELDDIMHTHQVTRGMAPGDRNSGLALSILADKDDTPLGVMAADQADGWSHIASLALKVLDEKTKQDKRKAVVPSGNSKVPEKLEWDSQALAGQTTVRVPLQNAMPHSRLAVQQQLVSTLNQLPPDVAASIGPKNIMKALNLPGLDELGEITDPHAAKAQRENDYMAVGVVQIPVAWDDHAKHIAEHNQFRVSKGWDSLEDEVKAMVTNHVKAHEKFLLEEATKQAQVNAAQPGFAALPQADNPIGSAVPDPVSMQPTPPPAA